LVFRVVILVGPSPDPVQTQRLGTTAIIGQQRDRKIDRSSKINRERSGKLKGETWGTNG
jgi:hypothetical protein